MNDNVQTISSVAGQEFIRSFIQFFFIAFLGGAVSLIYQRIRETELRRETKQRCIRDLIKEIDELYRSSKHTKRTIRFQRKLSNGAILVGKHTFVEGMGKLSQIQLSLESCVQLIKTHETIFGDERSRRIIEEIKYAEGYFNKVVDEYEKGTVKLSYQHYQIDGSCPMLYDYIGPRTNPPGTESLFDAMNTTESAENCSEIWTKIRRQSEVDRQNCKFKAISDEGILLAIREMREQMNIIEYETWFLELYRRWQRRRALMDRGIRQIAAAAASLPHKVGRRVH